MSDLSIACTATRTELSLADLNLNDGIKFRLVRAGPGVRDPDVTYAKSPTVDGGVPTQVRYDIGDLPLVIRVLGTNVAAVDTNLAELINTVQQTQWELSLAVNGSVRTYTCHPARVEPADAGGSASGGEFDKFQLMSNQHVYVLTIPRQPTAVAGPY